MVEMTPNFVLSVYRTQRDSFTIVLFGTTNMGKVFGMAKIKAEFFAPLLFIYKYHPLFFPLFSSVYIHLITLYHP